MATFRSLVSSLQIALKETFDDSMIPMSQIAYWCTIYINKARALKYQSESTGRYTSIFPNVPVYIPTTSTTNYIAGRKYIVLPANILDLPNDEGIVYISYNDFDGACQPSFTGTRFERTTITEAERLYYQDYEKPSPSNPYFYPITNDIIYLLGIECISIASLEVGLITTFDPFTDCIMDENMDLADDLFADVYTQVLQLGRFVMLVPSSTINDGNATTEAKGTQAIPKVAVPQQEQTTTE